MDSTFHMKYIDISHEIDIAANLNNMLKLCIVLFLWSTHSIYIA